MIDNNNINKSVLTLAIPAMFEMVLHMMVWTIDTAFIGRLTPAALAAVGLSSSLLYTMANVLGAVGIGATAIVSRNIGAKDYERASYVGTQIVGIGVIFSIFICSTILFLAAPILNKIAPDPEVAMLGIQYLKVAVMGGFFMIPGFMCNAILRGSGNTMLPFISAIIANTINIIGDYVLIFGKFGFPQMGVRGAALATATAQIVAFMVVFIYLSSGKYKVKIALSKLDLKNIAELKSIFKVGIPSGLESFLNEGSRLLCTIWLAQIGTISYAAHNVAVAAESLSFMPAYGFSIAAGSMVGRALGANNIEGAEKAVKVSLKYATGFMGLLGLLFFFFSTQIARIFSTDIETITVAAMCIKIGAFEQVSIAVLDIFSATLKGAGDTKTPSKVSAICNIGIRLPIVFFIVFIWRKGIEYVWYATAMQYFIYAVILTYYYKKGNWKNISLR